MIINIFLIILIFIILTAFYTYYQNVQKKFSKVTDMRKRVQSQESKIEKKITSNIKETITSKSDEETTTRLLEQAYKSLDPNTTDRFDELNNATVKSIILSNKLHDIANPIMIIMNETRNLSPSNKKITESINEIANTVTSLRTYLNTSTSSEASISETIELVLELIDSKIKRYNIEVHTNLIKSTYLNAGSSRDLRHTLINLIENAIASISESSHEKIIKVWMTRENQSVNIFINDNGQGIRKDRINKIFQPFYTTKKDGTGMGLFIAYKYTVDKMNGDLVLTTNRKGECTFKITLPSTQIQ